MSRNERNCFINRIKLLNFHNFSNATIEVKNGGHLFLLGDNGSGKTTVLDAIHYVLTAGEYMEFNAAARVTGNKQQGRRAQEIITRYNVDTGHIRPAGGVAYAALEIIHGNGRLTTAVIGMSVNSPEDSLTRWGIIRDCPFEEIPFLINDTEGERPRDKTEMKKALGGVGYFGQPQSFCNLLAERFLGGVSQFSDFCRFLAIGKAYREIAAHTTDYQTLFMRLLPESDQDIFERIIVTLRSIDGARGDLENLAGKLNYVKGLNALLKGIEDSNRNAAAFDAVELLIRISHIQQAIADDKENIEKWIAGQKQISEILLQLQGQKIAYEAKINDLKNKDTSQALTKEKELRDKLDLRQKRLEAEKSQLTEHQNTVNEIKKSLDETLKSLRENLADLMKKLPEKSIQIGIETGTAMTAMETVIHGKEPQECGLAETLTELLENIRKVTSPKQSILTSRENALDAQREQEKEMAGKEKLLLESREATPEWNGFEQLLGDLDSQGVVHIPIYKGLEWHPDATEDMKSRIEDFIGEELLSIIAVNEDEYDKAADIIFNDYPGHRLAVTSPHADSPRELREWASGLFDVNTCNPMLLDILLKELSAKQLPDFTKWKKTDIVRFRSHGRGFYGRKARFIGADSREQEQKSKIKAIREELKDIRQIIQDKDKECKDLKSHLRLLGNLEKLIEQGANELRAKMTLAMASRLNLSHEEKDLERLKTSVKLLDSEITQDQSHLGELRKLIEENDLEAIAVKMHELESQLQQCQKKIEEQNRESSKLNTRQEDAENRIKEAEGALAVQQTAYNEKLFLLEKKYGQKDSGKAVEELRAGNRLHVEQDAAKMASDCRTEASNKLFELKYRVNDITGTKYGFSYDQENNQLFSRDGITAGSIEESLHKNLEEQQALINEKTTELFKKLIMDTMLKTLWEKVHGLEKMERDINRLLEGRSFGNNTYRIKIRPHERYERLVKLIKTFTFYNSDAMEELEHFFHDYKDELINTPPGVIPEILDYRNWYRYEMCVYANSGGEGAVMDSRVKSVGSGGEQAVPNYLLVLTIAHFMFSGSNVKLNTLLFDEAFYGIDSQRRDQLMGFATDLGLQLFVASPDQDGVKDEIKFSTSLLVVKDVDYEVHLHPYHWSSTPDIDMFEPEPEGGREMKFSEEL